MGVVLVKVTDKGVFFSMYFVFLTEIEVVFLPNGVSLFRPISD